MQENRREVVNHSCVPASAVADVAYLKYSFSLASNGGCAMPYEAGVSSKIAFKCTADIGNVLGSKN